MRKYLIICALIIFAACDGTDDGLGKTEAESGEFDATVIGVEDCNMLLLEFLEEDVPAIQEITDIESSRYFAVNLKKILLNPGQKLIVKIRKLTEDEAIACPTFAPTYPGLFLISFELNP